MEPAPGVRAGIRWPPLGRGGRLEAAENRHAAIEDPSGRIAGRSRIRIVVRINKRAAARFIAIPPSVADLLSQCLTDLVEAEAEALVFTSQGRSDRLSTDDMDSKDTFGASRCTHSRCADGQETGTVRRQTSGSWCLASRIPNRHAHVPGGPCRTAFTPEDPGRPVGRRLGCRVLGQIPENH